MTTDVDFDQFQSAICAIYDAISEPSGWPDALAMVADVVGASGINRLIGDVRHGELNAIQVNPWFGDAANEFVAKGFVSKEIPLFAPYSTMFDEVRFRSTREMAARYQQLTGVALDLPPVEAWLLEDYGIVDRYTAPLIADPHNNDIVTIHFTDAELTTRGVSVGNMLLPHLAQAAKLSRPFALLESRFRAVLRVLDRFHLGVFFITAAGDIVIENAAARRILDQKDGVLRKSGQLHFHGNGVQAQFREICQSLLNSRSRDMKRLYVPRQAGHAPLVVECTTLSRVPDGGSTAFNGFLVIATDPEHREIIVLDDLNQIYGLTPAEAAVCEHVVSGYSVEEIAEIRGRSPETIRSQLKAVKRKCGVSNRVELVRRALDVSLPVDSGVKSELGR